MTASQKIQIRMSETREQVNDLAAAESAEDISRRDKLVGELKAQEVELRAAIASEGAAGSSPESREWAGLNSRFDLGEMFTNVMEHRASDGVIAEVQKERGMGANAIPTELLMVEHRAVTPAPTDTGQTQQAIEGYVFPNSVAAFLGIPSPVVPVGDTTFPVLTSDPSAGVPDEGDEQDETTGAFSAEVLSPARIQASFFWSREDAARMVGMGDALREALQGGIADKLDKEIMQGDEGLLEGTNLSNHARTAASNYNHYVETLLYGRVDGRYATDLADIRVVMGSHTFANASTKLPTNGEENALARIRNDSGGVRVSAHVTAVSGNKQNAVVRRGLRRDMVAPVWGNVTLIPDEISLAKRGRLQLTAVLLYAVKILRTGGFYKQETNHFVKPWLSLSQSVSWQTTFDSA